VENVTAIFDKQSISWKNKI